MSEPLSFDEYFISRIFKKYQKAKLIFLHQDTSVPWTLKEQVGTYGFSKQQLIDYHRHLKLVESILAILVKEEYLCLVKDFIAVSQVSTSWWKEFYSFTNYQKIRHQAINHFLYLYLL